MGRVTMFETLKAAWIRLISGHGSGASDDAAAPTVEYQGYRIRPVPYVTEGHFQTAGIIEKDFPDGPKQHRFVRADTHHSKEDAVTFTVNKAKQIIDLQGDRMFG